MDVTVYNSVIVVRHSGPGTAADAELLCHRMRREVEAIALTGSRPAILHTSDDLTSASREYATVFANCITSISTHNPIHVAQVSKSYLRVLARLAMTLSNTEIIIFRTHGECVKYLQSLGYDID